MRVCVGGLLGVIAISDPRGPAADPQGPGLGASGGGALCGSGGLLRKQVSGSLQHLRPVLQPRTLMLPKDKAGVCLTISFRDLSCNSYNFSGKARKNSWNVRTADFVSIKCNTPHDSLKSSKMQIIFLKQCYDILHEEKKVVP